MKFSPRIPRNTAVLTDNEFQCAPSLNQLRTVTNRRAIFLFFLVATALLFPLNAAAQPTRKKVLILTGADPNHPGCSIITQAMRSGMRKGSADRVEFLYELQWGLIQTPETQNDDDE